MIRAAHLPRILSCIVVAFCTVELCARLDDYLSYGAPMWGAYDVSRLYEFDALGRRGKPKAQFRKWKLNSLGYRGPEPAAASTRIVVFGASETFGLYESEDHEYPRLLEKELNERAGRHEFDVVNVAYAGMPAYSMIARVPEIVERLHPRYALIYAAPANYIWLPWLRPEKAPHEPQYDIRTKELLKTIAKNVVPSSIQDRVREMEIDKDVKNFSTVFDRLPEKNIQRYMADIRRLAAELRARGVEPVFVTHASPFHNPPQLEDQVLLVKWRKYYPMLKEQGFIDMEHRMNEALRSLGASESIAVIDAARQLPSGTRYFADFAHFTDEGSKVMAKTLANGLQPIISQCCKTADKLAAY